MMVGVLGCGRLFALALLGLVVTLALACACDTPAEPPSNDEVEDEEEGEKPPPRGFVYCEGQLVDLHVNVEHCGACGHACPPDRVCVRGECVAACAEEDYGLADGPAVVVQLPPEPRFTGPLKASDVTGDGRVELVMRSHSDPGLYLFAGDVQQGFREIGRTDIGSDRRVTFAVGDLNGSGRDDFVIAYREARELRILLSGKNGALSEVHRRTLQMEPWEVHLVDMAGTGALDLVIRAHWEGEDEYSGLAVFRGNGQSQFADEPVVLRRASNRVLGYGTVGEESRGSLILRDPLALVQLDDNGGLMSTVVPTPETEHPITNPARAITDAALVDLTLDGQNVLVASSTQAREVWVYGAGIDQEPERYSPRRSGRFFVEDFNGNGLPDIAVVSVAPGRVQLLENDGTGRFSPGSSYPWHVTHAQTVADITGNGRGDLLFLGAHPNFDGRVIRAYLNLGRPRLWGGHHYWAGGNVHDMAIADFDGDGLLDAAVPALSVSEGVQIFMGTGNGSFEVAEHYELGGPSSAVAAADINGNGVMDLAVTSGRGGELSLLFGRGDGTFEVEQMTVPGREGYRILAGDLDGNGHTDLVISTRDGRIVIVMNLGGGVFSEPIEMTGASPGDIALGDVNRNGRLDLVEAEYAFNKKGMIVYENQGDGSFLEAESYPEVGPRGVAVALADLNANGILDAVFAGWGHEHRVSVLMGRGDGTFEPPTHYPLLFQPRGLAVGDMNNNGTLDIVVGYVALQMLMGNGDGTFGEPKVYNRWVDYFKVLLEDVTGNGMLDVITPSFGGTSFLMYPAFCGSPPQK